MRFVVVGAGAVGSVIAARLHEVGQSVSVVARGDHLAAIDASGLVLESPGNTTTVRLAAVTSPEHVLWDDDSVVILAVKSHQTAAALDQLAACAPRQIAVVCAENGIDNERQTLRRFPNTYGMWVMCAADLVRPGLVSSHLLNTWGVLDLGRYPAGNDRIAREVAGVLTAAGFSSEARPDIMRWKNLKLLTNVVNAALAVCEPGPSVRGLAQALHTEAAASLVAAGLPVASAEEQQDRIGELLSTGPTESNPTHADSTSQSLRRGARAIEADYFNGEVVLLGSLHGVPTPLNELVLSVANDVARTGRTEPVSAELLLEQAAKFT